MQFLSDVSLEAFNTLALPARAANFCTVHTLPELEQARRHAQARDWPVTVLGGGSNVVLVGDGPIDFVVEWLL